MDKGTALVTHLERARIKQRQTNQFVYASKSGKYVPLRPLTKTLKRSFYPIYIHLRQNTNGMKKVTSDTGNLLDDQMSHLVNCGYWKQPCRCPPWVKILSPETKALIDFLQKRDWHPEYVQLMIGDVTDSIATRFDAIAYNGNKKKLILLEFKCGYRVGADIAQGTLSQLRWVDNNERNHHQLQLMTMVEMVRRNYGMEFDDAVVLYINSEENTPQEMVKVYPLETWCNTKEKRSSIYDRILKPKEVLHEQKALQKKLNKEGKEKTRKDRIRKALLRKARGAAAKDIKKKAAVVKRDVMAKERILKKEARLNKKIKT